MTRNVQPLKLGELFAGYGGLGMAVEEVLGAETAWFSEFEEAPSRILAHHWPGVPNHGDVTRIDWASVEPVDIISGGSPCQDLSLAGKRKGMTEGTRSNLWESMREGIATIRPRYVVWENVRGALSACATSEMGQCPGCVDKGQRHQPYLRALGRVLGDLSDLGFDAEWRGIRASDVGAPHGRYRIFVLAANRNSPRLPITRHPGVTRQEGSDQGATTFRDSLPATHGYDIRGNRGRIVAEETRRREPTHSSHTDWGDYQTAIRHWERINGPAPRPTEHSRGGFQRLSAGFAEWMMGLPQGWVTEVPGVNRNAQIKALGNGVVPQQAVPALRDMLAAFEQKAVAV